MRRTLRPTDDEGVALVAAVAVVMLVTLLMGTLIAYAMAETRETGRDRQRSSAIMRAEGSVDMTMAQMQGASLATLPCGSTATNTEVARDTTSIATTVTYYDAAGTVLNCPLAAGAAVVQALVKSTATVSPLAGQTAPSRTIESLVQVRPAPVLNKAIFGNAGVETNKHLDVQGSVPGRSDADVYSNSHVTCSGDGQYNGSLIVQGTISLGPCNVAGNAWSTAGVTASSTSIGGVLVSAGNAALDDSTSVTNTVRASGTIKDTGGNTWAGCSVPAKCAAGSTVDPPPAEPFPSLPYNPAPWIAAGYSATVVELSTCSGGYADAARDWILANAATLTQPTILHTTCPNGIYFNNAGDITLSNNLVVFASGGVSFKNNASFVSSDGVTMRYLYFIQPSGSVATPCTVDGIDMKNNLDGSPTVSTLFYTPCSISLKNNTVFYGQIYAGGIVEAKMNLTATYAPLPVYGVVNAATTYTVDIQFKRETH
jgi:hypothetical protein